MHVRHLQVLLSWCDKAFAHSASAAVRRDFGSAIAELHALAGWTAFDAALGGSAHRHFDLALNFAQDGDLVANIRYRMGRVHLHHGGPAEALGMFRGRCPRSGPSCVISPVRPG